MHFLARTLGFGLGLVVCINGAPTSTFPSTYNTSRPLVLWHGMGDSHSSPGMLSFMSHMRQMYPGIFIHSVFIEEDLEKDQKAGFFGNVDEQVDLTAQQLAAIPELSAHGFDAVGISQGGQFLRAFVERYNNPPVHNLITIGSQHMGVADIPACKTFDLLCHLMKAAVSVGVYSSWSQSNIVPAQYFRDPAQFPTYLSSNHFLTSINNEISESRNETYAVNFSSLANLVLVLFTRDKTVVPKESAWFGSYAPSTEGNTTSGETIVSMKQQPLYLEDWIGLRTLDMAGRVKLVACDGEHLQLSKECWEPILRQYVGSSWEVDDVRTRHDLVVQS